MLLMPLTEIAFIQLFNSAPQIQSGIFCFGNHFCLLMPLIYSCNTTVVISGGDVTFEDYRNFAFRGAHSFFRPLDYMVVRPFIQRRTDSNLTGLN
jgi:hypothetical protein